MYSPIVSQNNGASHLNSSRHEAAPSFHDDSSVPRSNWVTVFGFPPEKASMILNRFQKYGEIVKREDGDGNWVHLQYKRDVQARIAHEKNGKVFDGIMIGVKWVRLVGEVCCMCVVYVLHVMAFAGSLLCLPTRSIVGVIEPYCSRSRRCFEVLRLLFLVPHTMLFLHPNQQRTEGSDDFDHSSIISPEDSHNGSIFT